MKIGAYFHMRRVNPQPTGVGKHTIHMLEGLAEMPENQVTAILPPESLDSSGKIPANFNLASLPVSPLPYSRKTVEMSWLMLNWPKVDRWCPGCDWIYCPQEAVVATREVPLAVTVHDTYYLEPDHPWQSARSKAYWRLRWTLLFKAIRRHAKLVLAVSEFTKSRLVDLVGFDPKRIAVIGNAVDDVYFEESPAVDEKTALLPKSPYLYVVGGLAKKKGGDYLLSLARKLLTSRPDMRIVVSGISDSPYKEWAAEIGNIERRGYEPIDSQVRMIRGASALLMLSRYEGFGIPALEAMAAGTPAIVSRFASLPEVVGDAGLVVDANDTEEVIRTIGRVSEDKVFRAEVIAKGRVRAEQFRRGAVVARLYNALTNACG